VIAYAAAVLALSFAWSRIERYEQVFRAGYYHRALGYERTGLVLGIAQGLLSIVLFAMIGGAFWLFGWKTGTVLLFASFWVGSWR
jgi:hypothetical protein